MFKDLRSGQQGRFRQSTVGAGDGPGRIRGKESLGGRGVVAGTSDTPCNDFALGSQEI